MNENEIINKAIQELKKADKPYLMFKDFSFMDNLEWGNDQFQKIRFLLIKSSPFEKHGDHSVKFSQIGFEIANNHKDWYAYRQSLNSKTDYVKWFGVGIAALSLAWNIYQEVTNNKLREEIRIQSDEIEALKKENETFEQPKPHNASEKAVSLKGETKLKQGIPDEHQENPVLDVELEEYSVIINDYSAWDIIFSKNKDTIVLKEELGFNFENKLIEIKPKNKSDKFEVFIALENNLTVYVGEKDYQDLNQWKKVEDYHKLKDSTLYFFRTVNYERKKREQKLEPDFNKIKTKVLGLKGEYITERLIEADSLNKLPIELWISRAFLKIIRTSVDGEKEEIILINNSTWGC